MPSEAVPKEGEVSQLMIIAIDKEYQGKKLANILMPEAMRLAKQRGFKSMMAECTSIRS